MYGAGSVMIWESGTLEPFEDAEASWKAVTTGSLGV
jgi:hypothetical protein